MPTDADAHNVSAAGAALLGAANAALRLSVSDMSICEASGDEEADEGGCPSTPQELAVSPDPSAPPDAASLNVSWTMAAEGSDAEFYYLTLMREQGQQGDVLPQRYNVSMP